MDIATLGGLITGLAMVGGAIYMGGDSILFIDLPSVLIVVGGTLAAICVAFPFEEIRQAMAAGIKAFSSRRVKAQEVVDIMVRVADISRREGLIALENIQTENKVLKKACQLIADNAGPDIIHDTLRIEISSLKRRHRVGQEVFRKLAAFAPSFGMIGTLIGLVQMLARLDDPSAIGPAMALAILTTFYGATMSTLLFLPIAGKLYARTLQETLHMEIIFEGAKSILENNNPRLVYEKLSSFIAPQERRHDR